MPEKFVQRVQRDLEGKMFKVILLLASLWCLAWFTRCGSERGPVVFDRKLTVAPGAPATAKLCATDARNCATTVALEVIYSFQKTQPNEVSEALTFTFNFTGCEGFGVEFSPPSLTFTAPGSQKVAVTATTPCPCRAGNLDIVTRHRDSPPGSTTPHVSALTSVPIPECR
jgi:hypothetical protein